MTRPGDKARVAIKALALDYGANYPKAVAKIVDDADMLWEFYKYPAGHWIHLRTTNPIKSTFATVRLRTKVTKGPGSRAAGIAMAYKLIDAAQTRQRARSKPPAEPERFRLTISPALRAEPVALRSRAATGRARVLAGR